MKYVMTKYGILRAILFVALALVSDPGHAELREKVLLNAGKHFIYSKQTTIVEVDENIATLGLKLFEDTNLSFNGNISCSTCHLDRFGSADGLPNAIGVGGTGEGASRLKSSGLVVPRNTLPLWGRGEPDFKTFFWDGKVEKDGDKVKSQFGDFAPSDDPLIVTIHLPFVEIREMVLDDEKVQITFKTENVSSAEKIYQILLERVRTNPDYIAAFKKYLGLEQNQIEFVHIASAIKSFIQFKFKLQETRFEKYVNGKEVFTKEEIAGGLIFFGKGKCASCHSGRHFTDFEFHSIPFPQSGFGKNGFGVDYGRFNVTHLPDDLYKFRTPPLTNVENTAPYGHSGSATTLKESIIYHFDPLRLVNTGQMSLTERTEFYKKLVQSAEDFEQISYLDDIEIENLILFLKTLSYKSSVRH